MCTHVNKWVEFTGIRIADDAILGTVVLVAVGDGFIRQPLQFARLWDRMPLFLQLRYD